MSDNKSMIQCSSGRPNEQEAGVALLYALFAVLVAGGLIAVSMASAGVAHRNAQSKRFDTQAQYLAEGAVETAKKQVQTSIANWGAVPGTGTAQVGATPVDYTIAPTGFSTTNTDAVGIETLVTGYEINSSATVNGTKSTAHRVMNALATPLFQYAVFYDSDLEVQPGANMTIRGRVHTNRNMYLGSGATLTFNTNYLHAAGDIYRNRKDDPSSSPGTVLIRNWVANPFNAAEPVVYTRMNSQSQMSAVGVSTTSGFDSRFVTGFDANSNGDYADAGDWLPFAPGALAYWEQPAGYGESGNTVMTEEHGVTEATVPSIGSTAMYEPHANGDYDWNPLLQRYVKVTSGTGSFSAGFYHASAGLSVITYADGTWKAFDSAGANVTASVSAAVQVKQMYDARQANGSSTKIKVTQIDVALLAASGKFPANGLLYAANYGEGTGLAANGIRLVHGSSLPAGLTVATPDPMYIWGDYNTAAEKPAAVICDALNLLSSAWNDTKTKGTLPTAANTTYNVAVVTGNTETVGNSYNGGLENLPRFHENWDGKTSTIKGSFVKPWFSQYGTGGWVYGGDRYTAPTRNWSYNTAFNHVANLPPFTPMAVTAQDIVSWEDLRGPEHSSAASVPDRAARSRSESGRSVSRPSYAWSSAIDSHAALRLPDAQRNRLQMHDYGNASTRSTRIPRARTQGLTLLEVAFSITLIVIGISALSRVSVSLARASTLSRETELATQAARAMLERIQAEAFSQAFRSFNDTGTDDTSGPNSAPGAHFAVPGLRALPGAPAGLPGEVLFPAPAGSPGALREDLVDAHLGMPQDLDGNGAIDSNNHATDYKLLPVRVRVRWQAQDGTSGVVELVTVLANY